MFSIFGWPFRALVSFFRGVSEVIDWALQSLGGNSARPAWLTILMLPIMIPYWLGWTIYSVLSYPFSLSKLEPERLHNLYWGIPSLLALLVTLYAVLYTVASAGSIDDRYRLAMQRALAVGDFKLATILGGRLVSDKLEADLQTRFSYAIALRQSGETSKADAILADLAPSDQPGYSPAHRMRAMYFAAQLQSGSNEKTLSQLRWHLENSGEEPNAAIEKLWTAYFVTVGQPELAVPHMENAAKLDPTSLVKLANLYAQTGNKPGENRSLRQAESQFVKRLKDNPLSRDDRLQLALSQVRLEKLTSAEETMIKGVDLHNDAAMRRSAAEFYVMLFDVAGKNAKDNLAAQFEYLEKALRQDLFFGEIYERLIKFYQKSEASKTNDIIETQDSVRHADRTLQLLEKMLVDGRSPALVHFALSSIYEIRGNRDKATFHLLASYRLDGNFPVVTNNYAWMLAHAQNPDLPRAYELAMTAVRASPNDPRFLDTYATILMKLGKHHDAIAVFEKIVSQSLDKTSIHVKLAELYATVGMRDFAKKHQEKAEELTQQEAEKAMKAKKR
jgi:hypothetical protein